jgi:hypothetical protein
MNDGSQFSNVKPEEFLKNLSRNRAAKRLKELKNVSSESTGQDEEKGIPTIAVAANACPC